MDNALTGLDAWIERPQAADYDRSGCKWCGDEENDSPCSAPCEEAAEDDYLAVRRAAAYRIAEDCYAARTKAFALAARYMLEGDSLTSPRTAAAREQGASWGVQGDEWMRKARELSAATNHMEEAAQ